MSGRYLASVPTTIGATLKATRERRGWTRETLAHHAGLSAAAVAQIETGRRQDVRLSSLSALAAALEVSVDHLTGAPAAGPLLQHRALVHDTDEELVAATVPFVGEALAAGSRPLVVLRRPRAALVRAELGEAASDVDFHDAATWCDTPARAFDRYRQALGERLAAGAAWVWILAEPVWPASAADAVGQWMRYEAVATVLFASAPVSLLCAYDTRAMPSDAVAGARCTHAELVGPEGIAPSDAYCDPAHFLAAAGRT